MRRVLVPVFALLVAASTWQVVSFLASEGTDRSWRVALHLTWTRGIHFGSGFVWTYGPLGFLSFPVAVSSKTLVASFLFTAACWLALSYLVVWRNVGAFGLIFGVLLSYLAVGLPIALPDTLLMIEVVLAAIAFETGVAWFPTVGGVVAGLALLTKTNSGAAAVAIVLVVSAALGLRRLAVAVAASSVTFLGGWLIAGGSLGGIPPWLRLSVSIVDGYSPTMQTEVASLHYEYRLAVFVVAALLVTAAVAGGRALSRRRVAQVIVAGGFAFAMFKEGFVRHDAMHSAAFFAAIGVATLAFARRDFSRIVAVVGIAVCVWGVHRSVGLSYSPVSSARTARRELADIAVAHRRHAAVEVSAAYERRRYSVPSSMLRLLRGKTVHVDPFETAAVAAYGLRWRPLPIVQAYSAYTSALDDRNADFLASRAAPERILRENTTS